MDILKIALIQLCSSLDPQRNLVKIRSWLAQAKAEGVQAIFLPECFYSLSNGLSPTPYLVERNNEHYQAIKALAQDFQLYILGGSAATREQGKIYNRAYNFAPTGEELSHYDKMHLFSVDFSQSSETLTGGKGGDRTDTVVKVLDERSTYQAGQDPCSLDIAGFKFGFSICFDLRFPEMYRQYAREGADCLSISAAFTVPTGKAHWHILMRARAIENQCYVVAAAQWGEHNERVHTFGHSLVVDPWGHVLVDAGEGEKMVITNLQRCQLQEIRGRMRRF